MKFTGGKVRVRRAAMLTPFIVFPVILMILGFEVLRIIQR
jgi:hypothetical protein